MGNCQESRQVMEDTKRPIFGAEAERIGTRLDEATDEFLKDQPHENPWLLSSGWQSMT